MTTTLVLPMAFKDRLKALRKAAGLTQMQLAVATGLTLSAVSQMEAGIIANPRLDKLKALAKALNCKIDDLAQNGGDEPPKTRKTKEGK
jgi:transcriptional regulator with XRE-family HTH domain